MNEDIIQRIEKAGVKQYQIAEKLGIDQTVFCRMLQKELSDTDRTNIVNIINYLVYNGETQEEKIYQQEKLLEECERFITDACINVRNFCKRAKISHATYYDWRNGEKTIYQDTVDKIRKYLYSKSAQKLRDKMRGYKPIDICAEITGISEKKIKRLCDNGTIHHKKSNSRKICANIDELATYAERISHSDRNGNLAFGEMSIDDMNDNWRPILSANNHHEFFNSSRHEYCHQYLISDRGKIFDCTTQRYLPTEREDGYSQVRLCRGESTYESKYVHRLVAYFFCPNRLYKNRVHHIDGNKQNNRASNLIWVTTDEHGECHRLKNKDKKEYADYIKQLKKDNRWK